MTRPVRTAIYSLFIIGIFFSLSVVYQSCGKNKKETPSTENLADKVEGVADSYTEDNFFEDDESDDSTVLEEPESEESNISTRNSDDNSTQTTSYTPSASSISNGYVVIAGNYLLENNADEMVKKLKKAGYTKAQKVVFDLSQYYTVIAGKYESRTIANSVSSELNGKGIDNYVLRRKS